MTLTHRGTELLPEVRRAVDDLQRLFLQRPFEPAALSLDLRLVTDDWMGVVLLPRFVAMLADAAPGIDLDVLPRGAPGRKALLRQGAVDLAVGFFSGAGTDLLRQRLFDDDWVIVMREGHPAGESPLTVQRWAELTHIVVSPTGGRRGSLDAWLQGEGLSRRVAVAVPHFLAALALAAETDHVLAVPRSLAVARAAGFGLSVCEPPSALPSFAVSMCWHTRTEHDPAHRWLRSLFAAASAVVSRGKRL